MAVRMRYVYRPGYVWLMRLAHFRALRVVLAVLVCLAISPWRGFAEKVRGWLPSMVRDALEGDWS